MQFDEAIAVYCDIYIYIYIYKHTYTYIQYTHTHTYIHTHTLCYIFYKHTECNHSLNVYGLQGWGCQRGGP